MTAKRKIELTPTQWVDAVTGARIERTSRLEAPPAYAVRMHGNCLGHDGDWKLEPQPSSRDQSFLDTHRWSELAGAEKALSEADFMVFCGPSA